MNLGICCTSTIPAARRGSPVNKSRKARGPPVDTPMITNRLQGMWLILAIA